MRYKPNLGIMGNIMLLFTERNKINDKVITNKYIQDGVNTNTENVLCELDSIDRIAEIEEALCELDERLGGTL